MEAWEKFDLYRKKKIALYGLSTETQRFIRQANDKLCIVGLLDGFLTEGTLYGKKIMDVNDCSKYGVELIIVVARPGSCKAIARRIAKICKNNKIRLLDIRGKDLLNDSKDYYTYNKLIDTVSQKTNVRDVRTRLFLEHIEMIKEKSAGYGKKHFCIDDSYDVGYLFCAPIITDFIFWMKNFVDIEMVENVLMCARDGYLIDRLYRLISPATLSHYFYTSRTAAIRAGVENESDIEYVDSMKFSGSVKKNIQERFGILISDNAKDDSSGVLKHKDIILKRALKLKQGYSKYIKSLSLKEGDTVLFDFVAKGTTQFFLSKIISNHLTGLYFLQLEPDFMKDKKLDIIPFYTQEELETSAIYDNYYILETVLTSSEPSLSEINEDAVPIFMKETRSSEAIKCSKRAQQGIEDYFVKYVEQAHNNVNCQINKKADELFLQLIHNVEIVSKEFLGLIIEDPFFDRQTKITDVL